MEHTEEKLTVKFTTNKVGVDYPGYMSALEVLLVLQDAVNVMYKKAIDEEAKKVNQIPEQIKKLVDVMRQQKRVGDN